ncbi:MAG: MFS transporter [Clostridia bacterium]|nr:MFS transporter [Clostridia bacterium]
MTVSYAAVQFLFWFAYGTAVNFCSVYLLDQGLSNTAIGALSAAACALSVILQPLVAAYADKEKSLSIKTLLLGFTVLLAAAGLALIPAYGNGAALNALLLGCAILIVQVALPLINALATESINAGKSLNFSAARGMGSIGYAIMSFSIGRLTANQGAVSIPWAIAAVAFCLLAALALFPFQKNRASRKDTAPASGGLIAFLRRYPAFGAILVGCSLIYTSHVLINTFLFQIVTHKGGTSQHMGIVMGLAGLLEVITMFLFTRMLRWRDCGFWFGISGVFFTLKSLATLLAGSMGALYAVQLIQPMGWGLMTVSSVYYVNTLMAGADKIKGQAYMTMTLSVGTIIGSLCGGWLIDRAGVNGMLIASVACGAIGACIVLRRAGQKGRAEA